MASSFTPEVSAYVLKSGIFPSFHMLQVDATVFVPGEPGHVCKQVVHETAGVPDCCEPNGDVGIFEHAPVYQSVSRYILNHLASNFTPGGLNLLQA